jgi:hypothetical protein
MSDMINSTPSTASHAWTLEDVLRCIILYRCAAKTQAGEQCRRSVGREKEYEARKIISNFSGLKEHRLRRLTRHTLCSQHLNQEEETVADWRRILQSDAFVMARSLSSDCKLIWNSTESFGSQGARRHEAEKQLLREAGHRYRREAEEQKSQVNKLDRMVQILKRQIEEMSNEEKSRQQTRRQWEEERSVNEKKRCQWDTERIEHEETRRQWEKERSANKKKRCQWDTKRLEHEQTRRQWEEERSVNEKKRRQWDTERLEHEQTRRQWEEERSANKKKRCQWNTERIEHEETRRQWEEERSVNDKRCRQWDAERGANEKMCLQWKKKRYQWKEERHQWDLERAHHAQRYRRWQSQYHHHEEQRRQWEAGSRYQEHKHSQKQKMGNQNSVAGESNHGLIERHTAYAYKAQDTEIRAGVTPQSKKGGSDCTEAFPLGRFGEFGADHFGIEITGARNWERYVQVWNMLGSLKISSNGQAMSVLSSWPNKVSIRLLQSKAVDEGFLDNLVRDSHWGKHGFSTNMQHSLHGRKQEALWASAKLAQSVKAAFSMVTGPERGSERV